MFKIDNPSERLVRATEQYLHRSTSSSVGEDACAFDIALMLEEETVPQLRALQDEAQVKNANIEPILVRNTRGEPVQIQLYLWINVPVAEAKS